MSRPVTRSDFARMAGVSPAAITLACRNKLLKRAAVGDLIDLDHKVARKYLAQHGVRLDKPPKKPPKTDSAQASEPTPQAPSLDDSGFSEELGDLTLREIVERFGTVRAYQKILEAHVKREQALKNRIANAIKLGDLVARSLVQTHVLAFIDGVFKRLLSDSPKTLVKRVYELAQSGTPIEDAERFAREHISSQLNPLKATAERVLRNA